MLSKKDVFLSLTYIFVFTKPKNVYYILSYNIVDALVSDHLILMISCYLRIECGVTSYFDESMNYFVASFLFAFESKLVLAQKVDFSLCATLPI